MLAAASLGWWNIPSALIAVIGWQTAPKFQPTQVTEGKNERRLVEAASAISQRWKSFANPKVRARLFLVFITLAHMTILHDDFGKMRQDGISAKGVALLIKKIKQQQDTCVAVGGLHKSVGWISHFGGGCWAEKSWAPLCETCYGIETARAERARAVHQPERIN